MDEERIWQYLVKGTTTAVWKDIPEGEVDWYVDHGYRLRVLGVVEEFPEKESKFA